MRIRIWKINDISTIFSCTSTWELFYFIYNIFEKVHMGVGRVLLLLLLLLLLLFLIQALVQLILTGYKGELIFLHHGEK